jgi:hypothetical protein
MLPVALTRAQWRVRTMTRNLPSLSCKLADDVMRRLADFAACERGEAREVRWGQRSVGGVAAARQT